MGNISTSLYIVYTINDKESIKLVEKCYKTFVIKGEKI